MLLNRIREKQYLGVFNLPQRVQRIRFKDAQEVYYQKHFVEWKHPKLNKPRTDQSKRNAKSILGNLNKFFGEYYLDAITVNTIKLYNAARLEVEQVAAATINRERAVLSSLFSMFKQWSKDGALKPVRLPADNPCEGVPTLQEEPRSRVASFTELTRIKQACQELDDMELWSIVQLELKTTLRKGDLMRLHNAKTRDGAVYLTQGKTSKVINLPEGMKPLAAFNFVNLYRRWVKVSERAGLPDLQFRDLRRTGADMLKKQNVTDTLIKDTLGHTNTLTTQRYLNHKDIEALKPILEARNRLVDSI